MNIKAKKIKVVEQSNLHHEFINSKRNTIILVLAGEGTKDSFHIYYKDNANNKEDIGWIKISDKSGGSDSSNKIYNEYLEYVENNVIEKKYGADLKDLKKFMPVKQWMNRTGSEAVFISAKKGINIDELKAKLYEKAKEIHLTRFPYNDFLFQKYDTLDEQ